MMKGIEKLLDKKKKSGKGMLSDVQKDASMSAVSGLKDMANKMLNDSFHSGMKKVSVASDSEAGLEKGLDKAKQIISQKEQDGMVEDAEDDEKPGHSMIGDDEESEHSEMSEEEIDAKLEHLMSLKHKLKQ